MLNEEQEYLNNVGLIHLAIKNLHIYWKTEDEHQEYIDAGIDGLLRGIRTYDSSKDIKKSTYYYACISLGIKQIIYSKQYLKRNAKVVSLNKTLEDGELIDYILSDTDVENEVLEKERKELVLEVVNKLPIERDKELIKYTYGLDGYPLKNGIQLAKMWGLNKNAIYQRRDRAYNRLWRIIKNDEKYEVLWK